MKREKILNVAGICLFYLLLIATVVVFSKNCMASTNSNTNITINK